MSKERFETGPEVQVSIEQLGGDLVVRGWGETAVLVKGGQFDAQESKGELSIHSRDSVTINVPHRASVSLLTHGRAIIKNFDGDLAVREAMGDLIIKGLHNVTIQVVHGNMIAKNIDGPLHVKQVMGDLHLRNAAAVTVGQLHGDLNGRNLNGSVNPGVVMGDINLRTVNGDVTIETGHRDANLRNIGGVIQMPRIMGDIRTWGRLAAGEHTLHADGDIVLRWPANAPLNLTAEAGHITNRLPLEDVVEKETFLSGRIGDGNTTIRLAAQGRIILKPEYGLEGEFADMEASNLDFDIEMEGLDELGEMISSQINNRMSEITSRLEKKFGPDFSQRMAEKASRKAEQAMEKAMKEFERARHRAGRHASHSPWAPSAPPPPAPEKKASAEEQLQILRMLEKGIITTEEANTLLEALES